VFGWANIQNQILFVGVLGWEIFFFDLGENLGGLGGGVFYCYLKRKYPFKFIF
jgi:hypothetical protein